MKETSAYARGRNHTANFYICVKQTTYESTSDSLYEVRRVPRMPGAELSQKYIPEMLGKGLPRLIGSGTV